MPIPEQPTVTVVVKDPGKFAPLYDPPPGTNTIILIGGRGGMKTYEASKCIAFCATIKKERCVILRDEKSLIKESILNEILLRYDTADKDGYLSQHYERLETGIKDRETDQMLVFSKGFRASDTKKTANMKSISKINKAVIEEIADIRDKTKFDTFNDSVREEGSIVIMILNTPDVGHWIVQRYFNTIAIEAPPGTRPEKVKEYDGYFNLIPKDLPGFVCIQTSYLDNPHLPEHIISRYKSYGDPTSHVYDLHYFLTEICGYASTGRKGQILKKVKPIKLADYIKLPFREIIGQDFGTASPAGTVGVKFDGNNCYCRQYNYLPMGKLDIGKMYCRLKFNKADRVVADNADKEAWMKLRSGWQIKELDPEDLKKYPQLVGGFNVHPCMKDADHSIKDGLDIMTTELNLFAVEESKDLWEEIRSYIYDQDKYGNYVSDPIDDFNHLIDPWRYVVQDQRGKRKFAVTTQGDAPKRTGVMPDFKPGPQSDIQRPGFIMPEGYS